MPFAKLSEDDRCATNALAELDVTQVEWPLASEREI